MTDGKDASERVHVFESVYVCIESGWIEPHSNSCEDRLLGNQSHTQQLYLCVVVVHLLLATVRRIPMVLFAGIKCIDDDLLSPLDFSSAERTTLQAKSKHV